MRNGELFYVIFFVVFFLMIGWLGAFQIRYFLKRFRSSSWPSKDATIEKQFVGKIQGAGGRASFFEYRFNVEGQEYLGRFLIIDNEEHAQILQDKLTGLPIPIRYDPDDPKTSFIANYFDPRFEGRAAIQNPYWYIWTSRLRIHQSLDINR
jgi:hypothetical protein